MFNPLVFNPESQNHQRFHEVLVKDKNVRLNLKWNNKAYTMRWVLNNPTEAQKLGQYFLGKSYVKLYKILKGLYKKEGKEPVNLIEFNKLRGPSQRILTHSSKIKLDIIPFP